ncbi:MAG: PilZ domain-containing protein [Candidatus Omnitrophica bacterium]|nr:PilZ domain-containing protein [Candidatus Omnitrophota bacterium]
MYRSYSGNDRRRFQRWRMNLSVIYRVDQPVTVRLMIGDKEVEATTLDLSEGGMALLTDYNIPVGTSLFIKFTLFKVNSDGKVNFYGPIMIGGEVRSNIPSDKKYRLGICFSQMDPQDKTEMAGFLNRTEA